MRAWEYSTVKKSRDDELIANALSAYTTVFYDLHDLPPEVVFVPTRVLYEAYLRYCEQQAPNADVLQPPQFGRQLTRAFGVSPELRQKRMYKGRIEWGYLGVEGPGAIRIPNRRGPRERKRTPKDAHKAASPAPEVQGGAEADPG